MRLELRLWLDNLLQKRGNTSFISSAFWKIWRLCRLHHASILLHTLQKPVAEHKWERTSCVGDPVVSSDNMQSTLADHDYSTEARPGVVRNKYMWVVSLPWRCRFQLEMDITSARMERDVQSNKVRMTAFFLSILGRIDSPLVSDHNSRISVVSLERSKQHKARIDAIVIPDVIHRALCERFDEATDDSTIVLVPEGGDTMLGLRKIEADLDPDNVFANHMSFREMISDMNAIHTMQMSAFRETPTMMNVLKEALPTG